MNLCHKGVMQIKRFWVVLVLLMMCAVPAWAVPGVTLDGMDIGGAVELQVADGRCYAPLRTLSELLGADVWCSGQDIAIRRGESKIRLTIDGTTAVVNNETLALGAASYAVAGRTYVPIRFVAEALGCTVQYTGRVVQIVTEPLMIDGREVTGLRFEKLATMGSYIYGYKENALISGVYKALNDGCVTECDEPTSHGRLMQAEYYYYNIFSFMAADGEIVKTYVVYGKENDASVHLLYDDSADKWYTLDLQELDKVQDWQNIYAGELILNGVA